MSLGSFLTVVSWNVLFISDDIYIKVCDIFENCGKKKLTLRELKEKKITSELLQKYLNKLELFVKQGRINALLIHIAAICTNLDKIQDMEAAATRMFSAISKIPMNEYRQVEQLSAFIYLALQSMSDALETYVPADAIATASELLNKITYALNYKIEIPSYSLYDDYIKDFLTPAKHMVSSIGIILASRNKLIEKHEEDHPAYAETLYKYRRATKQCIASLELISSSLAQGLLQGQKEITFNFKQISFWVKVDTLLKMTHAVPDENDSHVKLSDELANELSKPMDSFSLSVFKVKDDLFWWKVDDDFDINTDFIIATVRKRNSDGTFSGLVEALDNRLDVYLMTKKTESSLIKGSTTFPPASLDDNMKDKAVTVHRLDIPTLEGQFHIKFVNFGNNLRLALEKNMRPDYELLMSDEAKVVNASETEFIVPFEANGGYDFFYIGLLPADDPGTVENNMLNCRCKHLSLFGGSIFVAPNKVDPINDIELFLTVADNPYIASIVLFCLIFYVLLLVWAWHKDKKDESYAKLIKLRDNVPGDTNAYVVVAYTGIRNAAGTTSNVAIQIYGSQAESRAHILKGDDVDRKVLQRGADDWFLLFTPAPLGELERIHVWLDFTGSSPSWYCSKLVIIDVANGDEYVFMVGKWLTILLDNELLYSELELLWNCAPTEKTNRRSELAQFNAIYGFREGHGWSAVFNRNSREKLEKITGSERKKGGGCCGFLRYHITRLFESSLTFKPLQPVIVSTEIEMMKKKQGWFLLGWFLCVFFILIDAFFIVLYSLKFGPKKSLNWLTAVTLGQANKIIIFEPLKVILFAVLLAVIFRKQPRVATYKIEELKPEAMISPYYSPAMRNSEEYSPPTIDKIKKLKKTYLPYWEQKWLLFNLIVTFTMLILFGILVYQIDNTDLYYNTQHITNMLTAPKGHTIGFSNVTNHTEYLNRSWFIRMLEFDYLKIFTQKIYIEAQIPYTNDCFNMLVKIPQIRQRRVVRGLCRVPEILKNLTDECQALLNDDTEDKSTYEFSWQKLDRHKLNTDMVSPWKYQEEIELKEDVKLKRLGKSDTTVPDMKGYTAKLDRTLQKSVDKLNYLMNNNWIDSLTRELFVELILYNVNTHMFCLVRLQVFHAANGIYRTHIEVDSSVIDLVKTNYVALFAIFGICCCILLICWRVVANIQLYGVFSYAVRVGKIWEFCSAVAGLLFIYYFSNQYLQLFMYSDHTKQSLQNDYISFDIIYLKKVLKFITMYLMGFVTMVLICSCRFGKSFEVIITTIWYSSPRVFSIVNIALLFVSVVELMFVLSQNPPLFSLSLSIYPFHYRSHFFRGKSLFGSKLLEFSLRSIFYIVHIVSLIYVLRVYIESRYSFVGRKSYNLLYFVYENLLHKFGRRN
ncbi:hypothetical protein LSTR_LSTR015563 [Laodelphax striatellus]|uniref:PLAT domain-containing protein n=1 Tax=Laodelphax striatellus TaxID=195883 RepID=A0A482XJC3_LAOST|nr:hypothetical protein LSTR_LSTR015563 [Laodelphax striatellus]